MMKEVTYNRRVLLVDDNVAIHRDFRKILESDKKSFAVDQLAKNLFDASQKQTAKPCFEIDSAYQGEEGFKMVKEARSEGKPYTLAFVDVRMPPGWDGVQTVKRIWEEDQDIQVVFCTAYSDYSGADILHEFGVTDRLLILKKPFDRAEVLLLATSLNNKWHLNRASESLTAVMLERAFPTSQPANGVQQ